MRGGLVGEEGAGTAGFDVDDVPDGVAVVTDQGVLTLINQAAAELLGVDRVAVLGEPLAALPGFGGFDAHAATAWPADVTVELPTGDRLWVRKGGGANGRKHTVLSLRPAADADDRADLIAIVAHELRSPVTSVRGFTTTLLQKWERFSDEQRRLMLETVAADADRLARLISELLDVARIDAGRLELRPDLVDVAELLRQQVERLRSTDYHAERLRLDVAEPIPRQWIDPDKFERIITNVVENALQHGAGQVRVGLSASASALCLIVDDEGSGIPESDRGRIFDKFWRANRRSGTGLGLFIVHGLVAALGGTVRVESAPTGGARFRVDLPSRRGGAD